MKLLAIDTSTEACSAALFIDGEISERYEIAPRKHAELILPMIDKLLVDAGCTLGQMDAIAFGRGPGAFTGVRIGTGVVQGLAFSIDRPVVAVSSLAAMAYGAMVEYQVDNVLAGIDARMAEVYWAVYQRSASGGMKLLDDECVCKPDETFIPESGNWVGVGTAWQTYGDELTARYDGLLGESHLAVFPKARDVAALGVIGFEAGEAVNADEAQPVYLRNNVAKKKSS
ncbi:MAG: tRNA (adenosine(37)-N6)-threonylcarbamoyltransferase complex dimerization subunit type 1 TsaB [Gammaproteobacteria bacterium]|nr:tRNA (adenosine(37)-N6)-threonylcarbamoyltransferase complex dimerization subunit type 1 TsaB [Gammaproteobacteria bacterium]